MEDELISILKAIHIDAYQKTYKDPHQEKVVSSQDTIQQLQEEVKQEQEQLHRSAKEQGNDIVDYCTVYLPEHKITWKRLMTFLYFSIA